LAPEIDALELELEETDDSLDSDDYRKIREAHYLMQKYLGNAVRSLRNVKSVRCDYVFFLGL
jgi:hypothetical protein